MAEKVRQAQEEKAKLDAERQRAALRLAMLEKLASEETVIQRQLALDRARAVRRGAVSERADALGWTFLATESLLVVGSVVGQALTLYNEGQTNDALRSGSGTAPAVQRARPGRVRGRPTSSPRGSRSSRSPGSSTPRPPSCPSASRFARARSAAVARTDAAAALSAPRRSGAWTRRARARGAEGRLGSRPFLRSRAVC